LAISRNFSDADLRAYGSGYAGAKSLAIDEAIAGDPHLARRAARIVAMDRVGSQKRAWEQPGKRRMRLSGVVVLASIAGLGAGYLALPRSGTIALGPVDNRTATALGRLPSGASIAIGSRSMTLLSTYEAGTGDVCRSYLVTAEIGRSEGVACWKSGRWVAVFAASEVPQRDYRPASGGGLSDQFLQSLGTGEALSPEEERSALAKVEE
jgi:hypothetical protein